MQPRWKERLKCYELVSANGVEGFGAQCSKFVNDREWGLGRT